MTEDQKKVLTDWAYAAWDAHWRKLAPKSNSRALFLRYVLQDYKKNKRSATEYQEIMLAIKQQTAAWLQQSQKEKVIGIPCLSSWFNAERWTDDIEHDNLTQDRPCKTLPTCNISGCTNPVHGANYSLCSFHIPHDHRDRLRAAYIDAGLVRAEGETKEDHLTRIKEQGSPLIAPLIKRLSGMP